jgi:hypothetical protein
MMSTALCTVESPAEVSREAIPDLHQLVGTPFEAVPSSLRRRVYGVPYVQLDDTTGMP